MATTTTSAYTWESRGGSPPPAGATGLLRLVVVEALRDYPEARAAVTEALAAAGGDHYAG